MEEKRNNATEKVENILENQRRTVREQLETDRLKYDKGEAEREAKAKSRLEKKEARVRAREQKWLLKKRIKEERLKEKTGAVHGGNVSDGNAGGGGKRGKNALTGWIAAVALLGSTTLIMSALFISSLTMNGDSDKNVIGHGEGAYYDFVNYVHSMDVDMSKLMVSNDRRQQQKILTELSAKARLAAEDVAGLPIADESKFYTTKFVNQVGDFSKYLNNKLIDGLLMTKEDKDLLKSLYLINGGLKSELASLTVDMGADFDFKTLTDGGSDNIVLDKFDQLESNAVDYPKLIYDGPFSDSLDQTAPKGLDGEEISLAEAQEKLADIFSDYNVGNVMPDGEGDGVIKTYNFRCTLDSGEELYAELSKKGGKLILFECYKDCEASNADLKQAKDIAETFLDKLGLDDMKAVWATEKGSLSYLNYVSESDGVVIYPDMVKVTVCKERKIVSSLDAREYYLNHTEREIIPPSIGADEARAKISDDISVETCRLSIVPQLNKEALAYEFSGTAGGATYYVYIDAADGKEIEIFRVVETTEGRLLI